VAAEAHVETRIKVATGAALRSARPTVQIERAIFRTLVVKTRSAQECGRIFGQFAQARSLRFGGSHPPLSADAAAEAEVNLDRQ